MYLIYSLKFSYQIKRSNSESVEWGVLSAGGLVLWCSGACSYWYGFTVAGSDVNKFLSNKKWFLDKSRGLDRMNLVRR